MPGCCVILQRNKMKNYKLNLPEMIETFRAVNDAVEPNKCARLFTLADMSEMVQKHAKKLGYEWKYNNDSTNNKIKFLFLCEDKSITHGGDILFYKNPNKKIGLEFFSIKPEKFVDVRMPEEDAMAFFQHREVCTSITTPKENIMKWELLK